MAEVLNGTLDVAAVRARFSSLQGGFAFLDAPGGSQVPDEVGEAIARTLREASANIGAGYATSFRVKEILEQAEARAARFLGCEPYEITFGPNMTSLDFALSRTAGREFAPGDEILVSSLDHDGGVAPWLELAHDRELVVRHVELHPDTAFDYDDLEAKLSDRTRVVAFAWASNAVGTIVDAARVCRIAHEAGALAWIDAVHYAAHEPIDVKVIDADVLICSPYKFCGPHLGVAYGRAAVTERWRPYKARPAPSDPLGRRFATGTAPYMVKDGFVTSNCPIADYDMMAQLLIQFKNAMITVCWSAVGSLIVYLIISLIVGLRVSPEAEREGLDIAEHGERAYNM